MGPPLLLLCRSERKLLSSLLVLAVLTCSFQAQFVSGYTAERRPAAFPLVAAADETSAPQAAASPPSRVAAASLPPAAAAAAAKQKASPAAPAAVARKASAAGSNPKGMPGAAPSLTKTAPKPAAAAAGAANKKPVQGVRSMGAAAAAAGATAGAAAAAAAGVRSKAAANKAKAASSKASILEGLPAPIPLQLLLGESKYKNPQLSEDGRFLAYIKPDPKSGVANVFMRKLPEAAAQDPEGFESEVSIFDRDGTDGDKQITFDEDQGVSAYSWSQDSASIFYIQDNNGDENYHLYMVPLNRPGEAIDLTPFPGVKAEGIVTSDRFPQKLYIGLNYRDPSVFDMYALDTTTLTLTLDTINPGAVNNWLMDYDFNIRGAECYNNSDGSTYVIINDALPKVNWQSTAVKARTERLERGTKGLKRTAKQADVQVLQGLFAKAAKENWDFADWVKASRSRADVSKWRRLLTWPFGEEGGVFSFNREGDAAYIISSIGRDTTEFQLVSTAPGAKVLERIAANPLSNVNSVEFDPQTWDPQLVSFNYLQVQWTMLDDSLKEEWARISAFRPEEEVSIVDRSFDDKIWILGYTGDSVNTKFYLHRLGTWPPELLFDTQPALLPYTTSRMHPVVIKARDGLMLPSYLTLPVKPSIPTVLPSCLTGPVPDLSGQGKRDTAAQRNKASTKCPLGLNLPLVLAVHGGPWSRDTWGAEPVVQMLANRGYAVLQVNYRASTGYGKRFANLGNRQWGVGTMQHDLTDAVKWAISKGVADPKKVCIMGGSYGGYATLAGLAFTPDLYACGVDLVGISNVGTFMRSIPPYWEPLRYEWLTRVGPADTDEAFNRKISPMYHVDKIKAPLFIAQGAFDPRVPQAESDQMYKAMFLKGRPVQYVLYTDEGHGISKPENRQDYYSRVEHFLAKHLGGRAEPPVVLEDVSAKVINGLKDLQAVAKTADKAGGKAEEGPLLASTKPKLRGS